MNNIERINTKKGTQSKQFSVQSVKITSYYLNVTDPLIIPLILFFYLVMKRLMITEYLVVKIQKLIMNHESQPVKSNPACFSTQESEGTMSFLVPSG